MAGVGNVLRGDDGFGVAVAERLMRETPPADVRVVELGIGGIHLVQELLDDFDSLIVVDAVDLGRAPGTVVVIQPDVPDLAALPLSERHDQLADMHYATPERAFMLAAALERLPRATWLVGCQAADAERYGQGLAPPLEPAVAVAAGEVRRLVSALGVNWPDPGNPSPTEETAMDHDRKRDERKTEQGDELTEEHSVAAEEDRPENPYRPARQPAQEPPGEEGEEGRETGY